LPFKNDGSLSNECWVIKPGNLSVKTNEDILKANLSIEEQTIDKYDIKLENIKFEYFPSLFFFN